VSGQPSDPFPRALSQDEKVRRRNVLDQKRIVSFHENVVQLPVVALACVVHGVFPLRGLRSWIFRWAIIPVCAFFILCIAVSRSVDVGTI